MKIAEITDYMYSCYREIVIYSIIADLVFDSLFLKLLLSFANPSDFRVSVDYGRNAVIVEVSGATADS